MLWLMMNETAKAFFQTLLLRLAEKTVLTTLGGYSASSGTSLFQSYKYSTVSKLIKEPSNSLRRKVGRKMGGFSISYSMFFTYMKSKALETSVGWFGEGLWMVGEEVVAYKKRGERDDAGPVPYGSSKKNRKEGEVALIALKIVGKMSELLKSKIICYFMSSACAALLAGLSKSNVGLTVGAQLGDILGGLALA